MSTSFPFSLSNEEQKSPTNDWVRDFFNEQYGDVFLTWPLAKSIQTAETIERLVGRKKGVFFDQCCGYGGLAYGLQQKGWSGFAVDLSSVYTKKAKSVLQSSSSAAGTPSVEVVCADAMLYCPPSEVDVAINWHTSLGYGGWVGAKTMLQRLWGSTKQDGFVVLELRNVHVYKDQELIHESVVVIDGVERKIKRINRWEGHLLMQTWFVDELPKHTMCYHPSFAELQAWARERNGVAHAYGPLGQQHCSHDERMIVVISKTNERGGR